ncbi:MAG: hypothetical protein KKC29_13240 [Alphaproteobacteria bacterium]|jgi:hypothetical protein|nr:hypothetical protein [Alphaproteobacteria bacterium]MBU2043163.1 hypothetical protein [Alphaproteobacteria bacterium]MBU2126405.1 hypothetical protein [Alphaproteobacteria bacterium]MBU2207657.1 hypothetical protein [Alphaproteobacteria bacterium]MBU2292056.1 hypothetical protein [Alphaproteobacteria bacterium]
MTDRTIRNLAHLRRSASTARVLNLLKVGLDHGHEVEWAERPLFQTPALNRSLIIKHRLRRDEADCFYLRRQVATKVVIPLDPADLKSGGRYVFVGQRDFERVMHEAFGVTARHPDMQTLALLDRLPSLDPFLLREQLKRNGQDPAACYFSISDSDLERMSGFVQDEIRPLVTLSLGPDLEAVGSTRRLASKIMSNNPTDHMEALRRTLRLELEEYEEGVFCWKGFIYYKWVLTSLSAEALAVADAVQTVRPIGKTDRDARAWLDRGRAVLRDRIIETCCEAGRTLDVYDAAFAGLTDESRPASFRAFLLQAPRLFSKLGDQLGAIQHIVSFWRFRFSPGASAVGVDELIDIFMDFETGLAARRAEAAEPRWAA